MTSKSSLVALGAMALIVLAGPALAQSIDLSPVQTLLQGIVDRNHHAHILLTTREIAAEGFTTKNRDWNAVEVLEGWREAWAQDANLALDLAGHVERIDHRTLEAQRVEALELAHVAQERGHEAEALEHTVRAVALDRPPLPQLSAGAWQLKERGHEVAAVRIWHEVKAHAAEVARVAQELAGYVRSWLERAADHVLDRL